MKYRRRPYAERGFIMSGFEQIAMIDFPQDDRNGLAVQARLCERYVQDGDLNSFSDPEILTMLIGMVSRVRNAEGVAADLLDAFGSMKGVLEARPEQLTRICGVSKKTAAMIGLGRELAKVWNRCAMDSPQKIGNSREAESYCLSLLAGRRTEAFYVIALNAQCQILGARKITEGSLSEVSAYPRLVMETALNYNAHSVLLSHNHPGGTCAPSPEDISSTLQLQQLLQGVGIIILDHIIIARSNAYSMIQHGDIDYRVRGRR